MPYAYPADMISRFGQVEMIRLTAPAEQDAIAVDIPAVERALNDASVLIDTYLRKRYQVPLAVAPAEISRAACMLARYDLSHGENKEPSEQTRLARKEVIDWLGQITRGAVLLDLAEVEPGDDSYAQMQDRPQMFGGWP